MGLEEPAAEVAGPSAALGSKTQEDTESGSTATVGTAVVFVDLSLVASDGMVLAGDVVFADPPTLVVGLLVAPASAVAAALQKHPMGHFQPWVMKPS